MVSLEWETIERESTLNSNYDLNIYDRGLWETAHEPEENQYSEWVVNFYRINFNDDGTVMTDFDESLNFELTTEESKQLGLPFVIDPDIRTGELFYETEDMWVDLHHLEESFKEIPERLSKHLETLPDY